MVMHETGRETFCSVRVASAPWTLHGSGFVLLFYLGPEKAARSAAGCVPLGGGLRFGAGLGAMILARYSHSPVGPYDELLFTPAPLIRRGAKRGHPITRIVVSSIASAASGRANWGIPKEVGSFEWGTRVRAPGTAVTAIVARGAGGEILFRGRFRPVGPSLRMSSRHLPRTLAQPADRSLYITRIAGHGRIRPCLFELSSADASRFAGTRLPRPLLALAISDLALEFPEAAVLPRR